MPASSRSTPGMVGATAAHIRDAVAAGQTTPAAVADAHLDHIARLDRILGAFQTIRRDDVLADADTLASRTDLDTLPLAGVPVAVKDNLAIRGTPSRRGTPATPAAPAADDDELVAKLRAAGALLVGTTRMPELGLWPVTEPAVFGPARNPWDLTRTPGGSSGGAGAALAAGMVPLAVGSDGAGSIRIPAACCGLVGLKPGRGTVPPPSHGGRPHWHGMTVWGPMATTVDDTARLLSVLTGGPPHTPLDTAGELTGGAAGGGTVPRRIAVWAEAPAAGIRVSAADRAAVKATGAALARAGHHLTPARPPYRHADVAAVIHRILTGTALDASEVTWSALEPRTRRQARAGQLLGVLGDQQHAADAARRRFTDWFTDRGIDALLTPALAAPPPKVGVWATRGFLWTLTASAQFMPFMPLANLAGLPAITLPAPTSPHPASGLPVGIQLLGPPGSEPHLLRLAAQLEAAHPWPRHAPLAT